MKWTWKIGRFLGIDVYIHSTFAILLAFVGASQWLQGGGLPGVADGVLFIIAVFACVVLHEYGHALAARSCGVGTKDITLLPIGGVARLERIPSRPLEELWIAVAGPMVNVVITGGLFSWLVVSRTLQPMADVGITGGPFLERLLMANIALVLFNMLPAFPMDGGRVLRALLALRLDYAKATRIAASLGQMIAVFFGLIGFLGNPMLCVVALFIWIGAEQEAGATSARAALANVSAGQVMVTDYATLNADDRLGRAIEMVLRGSQVEFPIIADDGRVVGVLTQNNLIEALAKGGVDVRIETVMSKDIVFVNPDEPLAEAMERISRSHCASAPVVKDSRLVGLLTVDNVMEFMMFRSALGQALRMDSLKLRDIKQ